MKKSKPILDTSAEMELIKLQSLLVLHRGKKELILNELIMAQLKKKNRR